jgi:CheY-like chemotaxis protein
VNGTRAAVAEKPPERGPSRASPGSGRDPPRVEPPSVASVLVVDDEPDFRETMRLILQMHGYDVITCRDGAEALALLRGGVRPCLILLDLMMPRMSGVQFREEQARDPALRDIPVVVLSGAGKVERTAAVLGVECFQKPIDLPVLLEVVERFSAACRRKG